MIVVAEGGGARQQNRVVDARELRDRLRHPIHGGPPVDLDLPGQQRAAHLAVVLDQQHARPAPGRRQRGGKPGGAAPDHGDIGMRPAFLVAVSIGLHRGSAQARRNPDVLFVGHPQAGRPHEGLVGEARRHQRRKQAGDGAEVEIRRGPAVHAPGFEAVKELDPCGDAIGGVACPAAEIDDGVRFLDARGHDPPRPVELETAPDDTHAIGDEGRRQGVARMPGQGPTVESEAQGPGSVDPPTLFAPHGLIVQAKSPGLSRLIGRTRSMSWVTVSRTTTNQVRQPKA